jgi:hypothetical protein
MDGVLVQAPPVPSDRRRYMDRQQLVVRTRKAAAILGLSMSWLEKARVRGDGPIYVQLTDGAVGYRISDLEVFLRRRIRRSTSDAPSPVTNGSNPPRQVSRTGRSALRASPAPRGRYRARRRTREAESEGKAAGD